MKQKHALIAMAIVFGGAALRLANIRVPLLGLENSVNFAPIGAIAVFSGLMFRNKWLAFGLPLACTFLGDVVLGLQNHDLRNYVFNPLMLYVYAGWMLYVLCGMGVRGVWRGALAKRISGRYSGLFRISALAGGGLLGSISFFIVTNFGVWALGSTYAKTVVGLKQCFVAAVPFFRATLQGDLLYVLMIVGAFCLVRAFVTETEPAKGLVYAD